MHKSSIAFKNNIPYISIDGELYAPFAYTAYFEERGEYADFSEKGCRMFFVNVSFSSLPINNITGFTPFLTGVFDGDTPDYKVFDETVRKILAVCPDAFIFPRINMTMPEKWINEHPSETVDTLNGGKRESLYSDVYLRDATELLFTLVDHIKKEDYSYAVSGYQLCGGTTQEWFHHDLSGSFSEMGLKKFSRWMKEKYGASEISLTKETLRSDFFNEEVSRYCEFTGEMTAKTVEYFTKALKEYISYSQIVGVFYGYNAFVCDPLWGHHGMRFIIDSPYIDFFSSPCAYDNNRSLGTDWGDMTAGESLKIHGKLYFTECDIRTYLTRGMQEARPGKYPDNVYLQYDEKGNKTVWAGPDTLLLSLSAIRKTFSHKITKGEGIWWFDMWGGWYHNEEIMKDIGIMKEISEKAINKPKDGYPTAEAVMIVDEKAYLDLPIGSGLLHGVNAVRTNMGYMGMPFDILMAEDAEKIVSKYRAAVFTAPVSSDTGKEAKSLLEKMNIPYIESTPEKPSFTTDELRSFLVSSGVHCYNPDGHIIHSGNGFLGVHFVKDGEITIKLPRKFKVKALFDDTFTETETDVIPLSGNKHDTAVFELT